MPTIVIQERWTLLHGACTYTSQKRRKLTIFNITLYRTLRYVLINGHIHVNNIIWGDNQEKKTIYILKYVGT